MTNAIRRSTIRLYIRATSTLSSKSNRVYYNQIIERFFLIVLTRFNSNFDSDKISNYQFCETRDLPQIKYKRDKNPFKGLLVQNFPSKRICKINAREREREKEISFLAFGNLSKKICESRSSPQEIFPLRSLRQTKQTFCLSYVVSLGFFRSRQKYNNATWNTRHLHSHTAKGCFGISYKNITLGLPRILAIYQGKKTNNIFFWKFPFN